MEKTHLDGSLVKISEAMRQRPSILIVEDDLTAEPIWTYVIEEVAPSANLVWATTEEAAEKLILRRLQEQNCFSLIIADVYLSGTRTGVDLWDRFGGSDSYFILMSVISQQKFANLLPHGNRLPVYLQKPLDPVICADLVRTILAFSGYKL